MDYQLIYNQLCARGQARTKESNIFYERHHIIPKSYGGDKSSQNMTLLTLREHYIAHRLLVAIYPKCPKMHTALWNMCNITPKYSNYTRYKPSSRSYEIIRSEYMNTCRGASHPLYQRKQSAEFIQRRKQVKLSEQTKLRISESKKGTKLSNEHKEKLRVISSSISDETRKRISAGLKGHFTSIETREKIRNANLGREGWGRKPILQFSRSGDFITEWPSMMTAAKETGVCSMNILQCCKKESTHAKGYIWLWKSDYHGQSIVRKRSNQKTIYQYDTDSNFLRTFESIAEAFAVLKISKSNIKHSLKNGWKTSGYKFTYQPLNNE
jgi:NUMOD1 domain/NUMOD3 motif